MKKYIDYTIQERKYSSNALMGVYLTSDNSKHAEYLFSFSSHIKKKEADYEIEKLKDFYKKQLLG